MEGGNSASALWAWERRKGWEPSGDAARSWDLFEEDLACLKALHLNSYRFSLEWSRVEPASGRFDECALERYAFWARRLAEEGIRPFVCFHHFSEPAWLLERHPQGWLDPEVPRRFLGFVEKAAGVLKPYASDWLTINEPMVFLVHAYGDGYFPPGRRMLLRPHKTFIPKLMPALAGAHVQAYELLHRLQPDARVGLAHNLYDLEPARPGDEEAVERWDWFMHGHFLELLKGRLDFLGVNYYSRVFVSRPRLPFQPLGALPGYAEVERALTPALFRLLGGRRDGRPRTGTDWEFVPEGLERVVTTASKMWRKPILITENGMAASPHVSRTDFLRQHLAALSRAMASGARVLGYHHWSLVDNYEWGSYAPRFGLFTRDRKPAEGSDFYARVAATGQAPEA